MIQQKYLSTFFLILRYFVRKRKHFSILARTSPLLSPPGVVVVDSRPPSNDSCADFCFKHETRYSWYDLRGKARHSDAFRASLARAHFSLQSSNRNCLVKSFLGQIGSYLFTWTYQSPIVFLYLFICLITYLGCRTVLNRRPEVLRFEQLIYG